MQFFHPIVLFKLFIAILRQFGKNNSVNTEDVIVFLVADLWHPS